MQPSSIGFYVKFCAMWGHHFLLMWLFLGQLVQPFPTFIFVACLFDVGVSL